MYYGAGREIIEVDGSFHDMQEISERDRISPSFAGGGGSRGWWECQSKGSRKINQPNSIAQEVRIVLSKWVLWIFKGVTRLNDKMVI